MQTHPKYPHRSKDTVSLLRSLVVAIVAFVILLLLTNCGTTPPRAILPPKTDVPSLRTQDVEDAAKKTGAAVREIAKAGEETRRANERVRTTTEKLQESIDRAEIIAEAHQELQVAFFEIQRFAKQLSDDLSEMATALKFAEERENMAIKATDDLTTHSNQLAKDKAEQDALLKVSDAENASLRVSLIDANEIRDKLLVQNAEVKRLGSLVWKLQVGIGILSLITLALGYAIIRILFL